MIFWFMHILIWQFLDFVKLISYAILDMVAGQLLSQTIVNISAQYMCTQLLNSGLPSFSIPACC